MESQYLYTRSAVKIQIPAATVVKVVVVATIAAYFGRTVVRIIDQTAARLDEDQQKTQ